MSNKRLDNAKQVLSEKLNLPKQLSFKMCVVIFLLLVAYVCQHSNIERQLREISDLTKEVKELRYEQITISSELMNMGKQSEVVRRVEAEGLGLKELTEPPRILEVR